MDAGPGMMLDRRAVAGYARWSMVLVQVLVLVLGCSSQELVGRGCMVRQRLAADDLVQPHKAVDVDMNGVWYSAAKC